jgi:hypothetical protein
MEQLTEEIILKATKDQIIDFIVNNFSNQELQRCIKKLEKQPTPLPSKLSPNKKKSPLQPRPPSAPRPKEPRLKYKKSFLQKLKVADLREMACIQEKLNIENCMNAKKDILIESLMQVYI